MANCCDRFWAKVLFKEFIKHYRKMDAGQMAADVYESMDALEDLNPEGSSFGAKMVRWSMERAEMPSAVASRENGQKGGRPKKSEPVADEIGDALGGLAAELCAGVNDSSRVKSAQNAGSHKTGKIPAHTPAPRDSQEVFAFAAEQGLDYDDTRLWWERNFVERDGMDKDGNRFANWKGALINACKAEKKNRRSA